MLHSTFWLWKLCMLLVIFVICDVYCLMSGERRYYTVIFLKQFVTETIYDWTDYSLYEDSCTVSTLFMCMTIVLFINHKSNSGRTYLFWRVSTFSQPWISLILTTVPKTSRYLHSKYLWTCLSAVLKLLQVKWNGQLTSFLIRKVKRQRTLRHFTHKEQR